MITRARLGSAVSLARYPWARRTMLAAMVSKRSYNAIGIGTEAELSGLFKSRQTTTSSKMETDMAEAVRR